MAFELFEAAEALKSNPDSESFHFNDSNLLDDKDLMAFNNDIDLMSSPNPSNSSLRLN